MDAVPEHPVPAYDETDACVELKQEAFPDVVVVVLKHKSVVYTDVIDGFEVTGQVVSV